MAFDLSVLDRVQQRYVTRGTSLFIETYVTGSDVVLDSFEFINATGGSTSEVVELGRHRLSAIMQDTVTGAASVPGGQIDKLQVRGQDIMSLAPTGYTSEGEFKDTTLQTGGPALDSPRSVKFGAGGNSTTGIFNVAADGTVTALKSGPLYIKTRLRAGRTGSTGFSVIVIRGEMSIDGGTNWLSMGNVGSINLDTSEDSDDFFDITPITVVAGVKFRLRFARSSVGNNSGDLASSALPGALAFLSPIPSAQLTVYRLTNYNYV